MELILLSLPIGNPADLTQRGKEHLEKGGLYLSEDTRVFLDFLRRNSLPIDGKEIRSFHEHKQNELDKYIEMIQEAGGATIVSDAGSPVVSDPAFPLIRACLNEEIEIKSIPGVSAPTVALELSGLPPIPFHFHGFVAREKGKIKEFLEAASQQAGTHLFFESPHRVKATLEIISEVLPESEVAIGRELTKSFESIHRFKAGEYHSHADQIVEKGEFTVAFHVEKQSGVNNSKITKLAQECLDRKAHPKSVSKLLSAILGEDQKALYKRLSKED
ncbi:MAG: 16S rRNA (cytidine(1402)-2'-O)-methyltransferase [Deltaproteobacteria bacterium]|nr:MAG: 16S rRNA (cytidine(1402)-2'-O)-methyltransferase [Deltaproteobacteria bacterium]